MALRTVRMRHPNVPKAYDAPAQAVKHWESRGWEVVPEPGAPAAATPVKTSAKTADTKKGDA